MLICSELDVEAYAVILALRRLGQKQQEVEADLAVQ